MISYLPAFALIFALSLAVSLVVTPLARRLGERRDIADRPGGRRQHRGVIPRLGGIALYAGFTVAVLATILLPQRIFPPSLDPKEMTRLIGLLVGTTAVFVFGLLDDRYEFPSRPQYVAQFLSALIALAFIIFIERVNNPFSSDQIVFPWPVVAALTVFWFMGMINTVNWLDGLDGLAAGVSAIVAAFLAIHMIREGQFSVALLPLALLGATLGFLPYNFNPAKIFMGSSGSYFLGWALAALGIMGGAKVATVLLAMGLPIMDVAWLIYHRWKRGDQAGVNRPRPPAPPPAGHRLHPAPDRAGILRLVYHLRDRRSGVGEPAVQTDCDDRPVRRRTDRALLGQQAAGGKVSPGEA